MWLFFQYILGKWALKSCFQELLGARSWASITILIIYYTFLFVYIAWVVASRKIVELITHIFEELKIGLKDQQVCLVLWERKTLT